jgi:peptidoglycan/LPS O-acetylase OafA/YrhL
MTNNLRHRPSEILSVQYLRALAATLVVFNHARQFPGFAEAPAYGPSGDSSPLR